MTEITNVSALKNAGVKPRLSLLSSKHSCTRLNPEESPPNQSIELDGCNSADRGAANEKDTTPAMANNVNRVSSEQSSRFRNRNESADNGAHGRLDDMVATTSSREETGRTAENSGRDAADVDKMSISKEDLIRLLSLLKAELQSKELALASIKLEQLKRLINPVEINRSVLASTYFELQRRLKSNIDCNTNACSENTTGSVATQQKSALERGAHNLTKVDDSGFSNRISETDDDNLDNITILNALLELLDQHPLLALPRDSIYCLDYSCNELSTKNYLNLKIRHLENLIDQHRRFRYFIGERLKRSEQKFLDLTLKLELERSLRIENEKSAYKNGGKSVLINQIDELKLALEREKASKHAIVMTLLNELLDERERNESLNIRLAELERKLSESDKMRHHSEHQHSSPTANQQLSCKPRVPAKPAQLLDRQRSQTKDK